MKRENWVWALCVVCGILFAGAAASVETYWELDGNAASGWLGTTNANPLTFKVNNTVGFRILKSWGTLNVIAGYSGNTVSTVEGASIGGGGYGAYPNKVTGSFGTVAGGVNNIAGDRAAVGGGTSNTASGIRSAIGGGYANVTSGQHATVGGGRNNVAAGDYATIAGGGPTIAGDPAATCNRATDEYCFIGGGGDNIAGDNDGDPANVTGATVAGGFHNQARDDYATVSGGMRNEASGYCNTLAGGEYNLAGGMWSAVGGGHHNKTSGDCATIAGGGSDPDDGSYGWATNNRATDNFCSVGGGFSNWAGSDDAVITTAPYATIAGGRNNVASADSATVGGGWMNEALASFATVSGGGADIIIGKDDDKDIWRPNRATDKYCTVGGGGANQAGNNNVQVDDANYATVAGGAYNSASVFAATVGGGYVNAATGNYAAVPGGAGNVAQGQYSFAAGRSANSSSDGTFTWADSTGIMLTNNTANRFMARAAGGVYFYTNAGLATGVYMNADGTGWSATSDRNAKENVNEVKVTDVLDKVAALPISTWNLKEDAAKVRHMGPMAQDLHAAFGLGDSDKAINSVDADGVALAAIQGLNQRMQERLQEQTAEIQALKQEIEALKALVRK